MNALQKKELEVRKLKAQAAIAELEFKIIEREQDIQRIKDHIELQKKILVEVEQAQGVKENV